MPKPARSLVISFVAGALALAVCPEVACAFAMPSLDLPDILAASDAVVAGTLVRVADDGGIVIRVDSRFRGQRIPPGAVVRIGLDASRFDPVPSTRRIGPHPFNRSLTEIAGQHRVFFLQRFSGTFYPTSDHYPSVRVSDTVPGPHAEPLAWIAATRIEDRLAFGDTPDRVLAILAFDHIPAEVARPLLAEQQKHPERIDARRLRDAADQMRYTGQIVSLPTAVNTLFRSAGPLDPGAVTAFLQALRRLKLLDRNEGDRLARSAAWLLACGDARTRSATYAALGNNVSPAGTELLRRGLDDPDPGVRRAAAAGLATAKPR